MMEVTKILYDGNHDYSEQISRRCSHLLPRPKVRDGVRDQNICQGKFPTKVIYKLPLGTMDIISVIRTSVDKMSYSGEQWVRLPNVNAVL